jgi:hypothetical protein
MRLRLPLLLVLCALLAGVGGAARPQAATTLPDKVFVVVGDEQALGRGLPVPAESPDPRVMVLRDGSWVPAQDPIGDDDGTDGVGPAVTIGQRALAHLGGPTVGLIVCSDVHSSMTSWKNRKSPYKKCEQQARPSAGRIVGLIFVEGTWDSTKSTIASTWAKSFHDTLGPFRADLGADIPAVVAQVGNVQGPKFRYTANVRTAQAQASAEPDTAVVATDDLPIADNGIDFTADAAQTLGQRLEAAWWSLAQPIASSDPPDQVIILAGQSNMEGRAVPVSQGAPSDSRLWLWRGGFWRMAHDPLGTPTDPQNGVGPGMTFGKGLLADHPGQTIGLVMCAQGSTGMSDWVPKQGPFEQCVRDAVATGGVVTGVVFDQGERDAEQKGLATGWAKKFASMAAGFRALFGAGLPIVFGQTGNIDPKGHKYLATVRDQQQQADDADPNALMVPTLDLAVSPDGLHFTLASYKTLGDRFADAWAQLSP